MAEAPVYRLRESVGAAGVVCSPSCGSVLRMHRGAIAVCGSVDRVVGWTVRTSEAAFVLCTGADEDVARVEVTYLACASDESLLAAGYADGSVRVWAMSGGRPVSEAPRLTFTGHRSAVSHLCFEGLYLASGARDGAFVLWDVSAERGVFRGASAHTGPVVGLFLVDGVLLSLGKDGVVRGWDVATHHCTETHDLGAEVVSAGIDRRDAASGVVRVVVFCADDRVRVLAVRPAVVASKAVSDEGRAGVVLVDTVPRAAGGERVAAGATSADGRYAVCLCVSGGVEVFRLRDASEHAAHAAAKKRRLKKASSDAPTIDAEATLGEATLGEDAQPITGAWAKSVRHGRVVGRARAVVFADEHAPATHRSVRVLCAMGDNRACDLVVPLEGDAEPTFESTLAVSHAGEARVACASVSADGENFVATASRECVRVWRVASSVFTCVRTLDVRSAAALAFVCGADYVLAGDAEGVLRLLSVATGAPHGEARAHTGAVRAIAAWPGGFASAGADRDVKLWAVRDVAGGVRLRHVRTVQLPDAPTALAASADGETLAAAGLDATVRIVDARTGRVRLALYGHRLPVAAVALVGDAVLTASADKTLRLWSLAFGECRRTLHVRGGALHALALTHGGTRVAVACADGCVRVFAVGAGREASRPLQTVRAHAGDVLAVCAVRDGGALVTTGHDRAVRVWREDAHDEVYAADEEARAEERALEDALVEAHPVAGVGVRTAATLKAGERIAEALDVAAADAGREHGAERHALFHAMRCAQKTPSALVLAVVDTVPLSDVDDALLVLPARHVRMLVGHIERWLCDHASALPAALRVLDAVLRLFHAEIRADATLRTALLSIRARSRALLSSVRDLCIRNAVL